MKRVGFLSAVLPLVLCLQVPLPAQDVAVENGFVRAILSQKTGAVTRLANQATGETYTLAGDAFTIETSLGTLASKAMAPAKSTVGKEMISFTFEGGGFAVDLHYSLAPKQCFLEKWIVVRNSAGKEFAVREIVLEDAAFDPPSTNVVKYYSYAGRGGLTPDSRGCPTALFLRDEKGGLFLGIENPFFRMAADEKKVTLSYRPMLKIGANETYTSEKEFIGVYRKTGLFSVKQLPTLSGWVPDRFEGIWESMSHDVLDWGEIWAMQELMRAYMPPTFKRFRTMMDGWWSQLPSLPADPSPSDVEFTCRLAANLREAGVNLMGLMAFPKNPPRLPEMASTGWEMNANVEAVIKRERPNGMTFGLYLGDASPMGHFGNSGAIDFLPEKEEWKKRNTDGEPIKVNCLGSDEFAEWFFKVQDSTIRQYELGWWQWDGGIGTWDVCCAKNHRHLPGENAYAEWRARMDLIRKLKEAHPDVWFHIYWGLKPYGPWGLRWVDTHENYYEMGEARLFPTLWSDHRMADDGRLQFWWNQNSRFLPHYRNYAQIGHAAFGPGASGSANEIERGEFWEEHSWKYALLSVIGASGSGAVNTFPNDLAAIRSQDLPSFYKKWLHWADENYEYVKVSRDIFGPPGIGAVDGYAHIIGDRGFVFLFNPNQREIDVDLPLDDKMLLVSGKKFVVKELYPEEGRHVIWAARGVFPRGMEVTITVPPENVVVLEIKPYDGKTPMLFGVPGDVKQEGEEVVITGVTGEEGSTSQLLVLVDEPRKVKTVRINEQEARFRFTDNNYLRSVVQFAGVRIVCELDNWDVGGGGGRLPMPNTDPMKEGTLLTTFFLPGKVKEILEAHKPLPRPSGKPTPPTADAGRLLVSIPLTFSDSVCNITAKINDQAVPVQRAGLGRFADITDHVVYDRGNSLKLTIPPLLPGQFLGPRIESVPVQITDRLKVLPEGTRTLTKLGPPPQKPFWDANTFAQIRKEMAWAAKVRAELLDSYHSVHQRDGVPHRIEFATKDRPDDEWGSENLIDDDTGRADGTWQMRGSEPAEAVIGFEGKTVKICGVSLFNNSSDPPSGLARDFAVYISGHDEARKNPRHPSWTLVFKGRLEAQSESFQDFTFPPVQAKYVRLRLIDNHFGDTIGVGELKFRFK